MRLISRLLLVVLMVSVVGNAMAQDEAIHVPIPEGWTAPDDEYRYDRDDLWEYINGAAELFLTYGFNELIVRDLEQGELFLTVSVYDMGRPLDAYGVYEVEKPTEAQQLTGVGASAVVQPPYRALLLKDRFYVKVEIGGEDMSAEALATVLTAVADGLPGTNDLPSQLAALPEADRVAGTVAFTGANYLGLEDLSNCLHADYVTNDGLKFGLFAMSPTRSFLRKVEEKWTAEDHKDGTRFLYREIPYSGVVVLLGDAQQVLGINGLSDLDQAKTLLESIVE